MVYWAIVREGQLRPRDILMLLDARDDADTIASELGRRGHHVEVVTYSNGIVRPPRPAPEEAATR